MKNLFDIKDKVVVITGGTGVLGKAIAFHLAEEGQIFYCHQTVQFLAGHMVS